MSEIQPPGRTLKKRRRSKEKIVVNCLFLLPAVVLIGVYIVYPIINSFYISMFEWNGLDPVKKFVGLANWETLLHDPVFGKAVLNNVFIVVLSIVIQLPLGMIVAILLAETKHFAKLLKTAFFLPMLMSAVSIGILFTYILDPNFGVVTAVAEALNMAAPDLLGSQATALFTVVLVICWQFTPFYMVLFVSALATVPADTKEYSQIDGANKLQYYIHIAIPIVKNNIFTAMVLSLIGSLKYFDLVYVLTNGGPSGSTELMATYMYKTAFTSSNKGYGSTIAMALFIIVMIFSMLCNWLPRKISKRGERRS